MEGTDSPTMLAKVRYQVVPEKCDHTPYGFYQLDVHFPRFIFGSKFGCEHPTRFTQQEVVGMIAKVSKKLSNSSGDKQTDLAAHLQVWSGLLRAIGPANSMDDDVYDIVVWF